ncbi:MAG: EpsI family protein [Ideonella sp. MAG2]|nr:MAG: EpsI family protein [Ideonella sp. MAG2]
MSKTTSAFNPLRQAMLAALLMLLCGLLAWSLTPRRMLVDVQGRMHLEQMMPKAFGDWTELAMNQTTVINPQQAEQLSRIYSQTLSRVYINSQGQRVMVSLAYGEDQRDGKQLHYPEVCYPAQGFRLLAQEKSMLQLGDVSLPIKRLSTQLGTSRRESVTYWTLVGDQPFSGGIAKKLTEMRYGLRGVIPDGLLFRVSSIEVNPAEGYAIHQRFAESLFAALPAADRARLMGQANARQP